MDSSCAVSAAARFLSCGGRLCYLNEGLISVLKLIISETNSAAFSDSGRICCNHFKHFTRLIAGRCFAPNCESPANKQSLRKCPANMLTYLNLDETAQVLIHQSCYLRLKQLLQPNSNPSISDSSNNNNDQENQPPVIDTSDRTAEIATHEYLTAKQSITPPGSPIQTNGERGRSKTWHHIP
jgi:hypothetical protein